MKSPCNQESLKRNRYASQTQRFHRKALGRSLLLFSLIEFLFLLILLLLVGLLRKRTRRNSLRPNYNKSRRASSEDVPAGETSEESKSVEDRLTKEEWQSINKLLSHQPDENVTLQHGKEMRNTINYLIDVSIGRAAAMIINVDQTEILCGRFEHLNVSSNLKHRTIHCDVSLKFYGLSAPEGSLAQMTPLFDVTITNLKLATHGSNECCVLISSIAASTFNTHLQAWEPLVETFDGIVIVMIWQ